MTIAHKKLTPEQKMRARNDLLEKHVDDLQRKVEYLEEELADCLAQLEDINKSKNEAENIKNQLLREKSSYQMQLEETEEQLAEVSGEKIIIKFD